MHPHLLLVSRRDRGPQCTPATAGRRPPYRRRVSTSWFIYIVVFGETKLLSERAEFLFFVFNCTLNFTEELLLMLEEFVL